MQTIADVVDDCVKAHTYSRRMRKTDAFPGMYAVGIPSHFIVARICD